MDSITLDGLNQAARGDDMYRAMYSLMWFGLLRPREATLTADHPVYDVSRHPSMEDVRFMDGEVERFVGDGGGYQGECIFV